MPYPSYSFLIDAGSIFSTILITFFPSLTTCRQHLQKLRRKETNGTNNGEASATPAAPKTPRGKRAVGSKKTPGSSAKGKRKATDYPAPDDNDEDDDETPVKKMKSDPDCENVKYEISFTWPISFCLVLSYSYHSRIKISINILSNRIEEQAI